MCEGAAGGLSCGSRRQHGYHIFSLSTPPPTRSVSTSNWFHPRPISHTNISTRAAIVAHPQNTCICVGRLKAGNREGPPLSTLPDHRVQMVLSPAGLPGQCLPLNGSLGHVDIRLRTRTYVDAVTLEHVPR